VKFPRATRPLIHTLLKFILTQDIESIKIGAEAPQCFFGK